MPMRLRERKRRRIGSSLLIGAFFWIIVNAYSAPYISAQGIHIKVLDGRNGKPVSGECVNVWIGQDAASSLLVPTDKSGVALVHLTTKSTELNAHQSGKACGGWGVIEPTLMYADTIGITSGSYMPCEPHPANSPRLSFSVQEVLRSGATTTNTCGKIEGHPQPGELIFFVRPLRWWEKLKR